MRKDKTLRVRLDEQEMASIEHAARERSQDVSAYARDILTLNPSGKNTVPNIPEDWVKLIPLLGEKFLDKIAVMSGDRFSHAVWAVYLLQALNMIPVAPQGVVISHGAQNRQTVPGEATNPYVGWEVETNPDGLKKPYWSEHYEARVIVLVHPTVKSKTVVLKEGEPFYQDFANQ